MLDVKIKVTDLSSGQQYLLLVAKMNLKGLLLNAAPIRKEGALLELSIQIQNDPKRLELNGKIYKILEHSGGRVGTIVEFVDPTSEQIRRINKFLQSLPPDSFPSPEKTPASPSLDATALVDLETLSRLVLSSSDQKEEPISSTLDEEVIHANKPGLAGKTKIAFLTESALKKLKEKQILQKKPSFRMTLVLLFLGLLILGFFSRPMLRFLDLQFGIFSPDPSDTIVAQGTPSFSPAQETPTPVFSPTSIPLEKNLGKIAEISVKNFKSFIRIDIRGDGTLPKPFVNQTTSPPRLFIDFPRLSSFLNSPRMAVVQSPLLWIETSEMVSGVRVAFHLYPDQWSRFTTDSPSSDVLEVSIHR